MEKIKDIFVNKIVDEVLKLLIGQGSDEIKDLFNKNKNQNILLHCFEKCKVEPFGRFIEIPNKSIILDIKEELIRPGLSQNKIEENLESIFKICIITDDKEQYYQIVKYICMIYIKQAKLTIQLRDLLDQQKEDSDNVIKELETIKNMIYDSSKKNVSQMSNQLIQELKKSNSEVIRELKGKNMIGMLGIDEKDTLEINLINEEYNPDVAKFNFFGTVLNYTNMYEIGTKYALTLNVKNIGQNILSNAIMKKIRIFRIDNFENDSLDYVDIFSSEKELPISNCILPQMNNEIIIIFDLIEDEFLFTLNENTELSSLMEDDINSWTEDIMITMEVSIGYVNDKELTQTIILYCSNSEYTQGKYIIESVQVSFN